MLETIAQNGAVIASMERTVRQLRRESEILREAVSMLTANLEARSAPNAADEVMAANTNALRARVRALISAADATTSAAAGGDAPRGSRRSVGVSDALAAPQEISIRCSGDASITTAPLHADDAIHDECLILDFVSADASARFAVYCDGAFDRADREAEDVKAARAAADEADILAANTEL